MAAFSTLGIIASVAGSAFQLLNQPDTSGFEEAQRFRERAARIQAKQADVQAARENARLIQERIIRQGQVQAAAAQQGAADSSAVRGAISSLGAQAASGLGFNLGSAGAGRSIVEAQGAAITAENTARSNILESQQTGGLFSAFTGGIAKLGQSGVF